MDKKNDARPFDRYVLCRSGALVCAGGIVRVAAVSAGEPWAEALKAQAKNYFLNRDRERYAETLYASQDGYFAFLYPDQKSTIPGRTLSSIVPVGWRLS